MIGLPFHCFTIVLNGMPFLPSVYIELNRMQEHFHWHAIEGACSNFACSRWMQPQQPHLSDDGTSEWLDSVAHDPRVTVYRKPLWKGKIEMVNAPLANIHEECVLVECDSDETFSADQFRSIRHLFEDDPSLMSARFDCNYYVGAGLVLTDSVDWWRAWRFKPGMRWDRHEPPVLAGNNGKSMSREDTRVILGKFSHFSWFTPKQVETKARLYGPRYKDALEGWHRLQRHDKFPVSACAFFPWMGPSVMVDRISNAPHSLG